MKSTFMFIGLLLCYLLASAQTPNSIAVQQNLPIGSSGNAIKGVAYGNNLYVAAGNGTAGCIYTSTNATDWQKVTDPSVPSAALFNDAVFGGGVYVLVGDNGVVVSSTNGTTWTVANLGISNRLNDVAYLNGNFYVVGDNDAFYTSSNGTTWSAVSIGSTGYHLMSIDYGNNTFAIGARLTSSSWAYIFRSTTGTSGSWPVVLLPQVQANGLNQLRFLKNKFYVFDASTSVWSSSDASSWTNISSSTVNLPGGGTSVLGTPNQSFTGVYDGTKFYFYGTASFYNTPAPQGAVFSSSDGITFTLESKTTSINVTNSAYLNGYYFITGNEGLVYSINGSSYQYPYGSYNAIATNGSLYVAATSFASTEGGIYTSSNFTNWTNQNIGVTYALNGVTYGNNMFVAVGNVGTTARSTNGTSWTLGTTGDADGLKSVAYGNNKYVAVGNQGKIVYSSDGITWTQANKDGAAGSNFNSVKYLNNLFIAVGGQLAATGVARLAYSADGVNWTTNSPSVTGSISDIAYDGSKYVLFGRLNNNTATSRLFFSLTSTNITTASYSGITTIPASSSNNIPLVIGGSGTIDYSGGYFVIGTNQNTTPFDPYLLTSTDGATWTVTATAGTGRYRGMISSGTTFYAVGLLDYKVKIMMAAATPTLATSGTLTSFSACAGATSSAQSITVSGTNLTGAITVATPSGFELALTSGGPYSSSINLTPSSGTVTTTTVFVRLTNTTSGSPSGSVTITSSGATTINVSVSGVVTSVATPVITAGSSTTLCSGGSVSLSSNAPSGNQWYLNGGAISGAINTSYSTTAAGSYTVIVTVAGCLSASSNSIAVAVNTPTTWYLDADNDGYYISTALACTSPGAGYNQTATSSGDCNDNDNSIHSAKPYYVDADHDGYGTGGIVQLCSNTAPFGFSAVNTDCNDANAAINPGAIEVIDGIDNNCNTLIDENLCGPAINFVPTYAAGSLSATWTSYTTFNDSLYFQRVGYNFAPTKIAASGLNNRSASDNTPVIGYTYDVWVEGRCNVDSSIQSTTHQSVFIPGGPCDLKTVTITSINATISCPSISATLTWTASPSNAYQIAYRKIYPIVTAYKYKNELNTTADSITVLDGVGIYQFSIRAKCTAAGASYGPNSNLVTYSCTQNCFDKIIDFDAHTQDMVNCKKIILDWTPTNCDAIQGYQIRYRLDNNPYYSGVTIPNVHHYTFVAAATGANRKYRFYITPILCGNIYATNSNIDSATINYLAAQPNSCPLTVRLVNDEESIEIHEPAILETVINVQPNPSNGIAELTVQNQGQIRSIDLVNMYGQLIRTYQLEADQNSLKIQETNLTAGQYLFVIKDGNGQLIAKQIWMVTKD